MKSIWIENIQEDIDTPDQSCHSLLPQSRRWRSCWQPRSPRCVPLGTLLAFWCRPAPKLSWPCRWHQHWYLPVSSSAGTVSLLHLPPTRSCLPPDRQRPLLSWTLSRNKGSVSLGLWYKRWKSNYIQWQSDIVTMGYYDKLLILTLCVILIS